MTTTASESLLWGIDLDQRYQHAFDFRYAVWLTAADEWFQLDHEQLAKLHQEKMDFDVKWQATEQRTARLRAEPRTSEVLSLLDQDAKARQALKKKMADKQKEIRNKNTRLDGIKTIAATWSQRLEHIEDAVVCQWCGRETHTVYLSRDGHQKYVDSKSFNNVGELRGWGLSRALCPACGWGYDSSHMGESDGIPGMNQSGKLLGITVGSDGMAMIVRSSNYPWYKVPWGTATRASWFYATKDYSKIPWFSQVFPTHDPRCASIWVNGTNYTLDATQLIPLQEEAKELVETGAVIADAEERKTQQQEFREKEKIIQKEVADALDIDLDHPLMILFRFPFELDKQLFTAPPSHTKTTKIKDGDTQ